MISLNTVGHYIQIYQNLHDTRILSDPSFNRTLCLNDISTSVDYELSWKKVKNKSYTIEKYFIKIFR